MQSSFAANQGSTTLPSDTYLQNSKGMSIGYFRSEVLRTDQNNVATGEHDYEIRLPANALFAIKVDGQEVKPGETFNSSKTLNNGILSLDIAPLRKKDIGKVEYEVYIPSLYSIDDRFWEVFDPTYTKWLDSGQNVEHESWLPPLAQQMTDFTQTRKYKDVYTRERQDRDKDTNVGEIRNHGDPVTEYDYRPNTESRDVKASVDAYVNTGELHDCGDWVPPASETYEGLSVDQTFTCQQDQTRTWTYKVGSYVIGTHPQLQSIDDIKYRTVPGTKNPWLSTASAFGEWSNTGEPYQISSWEPPIVAQTANFTQSRSYKQNQTRTEQKQQKNAVTGEIRSVGELKYPIKAVTVNQQRTIAVSVSGWSNSGSAYNCGAWTPAANTVSSGTRFTQTQGCTQMQVRTWSYKDGSTVITTRPENRTVSLSPNRSAVGTKSTLRLVKTGSYHTYRGELSYELSFAREDGDTIVNSSAYDSQAGKACSPEGHGYTYYTIKDPNAYFALYKCQR
ncbi:hypothetical protein QFW85_00470 (plasmid) [Vibrio chagasii]|uniref:hypothetical protein n=1 Tax=Vibrio TaxID=662 RepID=UPI002160AD2D|nr:hypothetical protein [Vibrio alginolyticus]